MLNTYFQCLFNNLGTWHEIITSCQTSAGMTVTLIGSANLMIHDLNKSFQMLIHNKILNKILRPAYLLLILGLNFSCSHIPNIYPTEITNPNQILEKCRCVFPDNDWHFVHLIEATLSKEHKAFMMGITRISPQSRTIEAVMMTFEGMVLFDAYDNGKIIINRAIPPFDSEFFAQGLMEDIRLIFFQPKEAIVEWGLSDTGKYICRYHGNEETITDVIFEQNDRLTVSSYHRHRLHREIRFYRGDKQSPPFIFQRLELIAHRPVKYKMDLNLLESEPLTR
jgi:hypothetical protein